MPTRLMSNVCASLSHGRNHIFFEKLNLSVFSYSSFTMLYKVVLTMACVGEIQTEAKEQQFHEEVFVMLYKMDLLALFFIISYK